eukprot:5096539-Alexandrium_andersonii.AAC.1
MKPTRPVARSLLPWLRRLSMPGRASGIALQHGTSSWDARWTSSSGSPRRREQRLRALSGLSRSPRAGGA